MRVLIAPDKFKGSLSASAVSDNLAHGLIEAGAEVVTLPLADGGDGSVAAALAAGLQPRTFTVADALGQPHATAIAVGETTAVVEIASSCGLSTLPPGTLAAMTASSFGFGEAVRHAAGLGVRRIVLALGGSASTDGGAGMFAALGFRFVDRAGHAVMLAAHNLHRIDAVHADDAVDLRAVDLVVASDVTTDTAGDPQLTAAQLRRIGADIGRRFADRTAYCRVLRSG